MIIYNSIIYNYFSNSIGVLFFPFIFFFCWGEGMVSGVSCIYIFCVGEFNHSNFTSYFINIYYVYNKIILLYTCIANTKYTIKI